MTNIPPFPTHGRLAGVDFGTVRIGIAVCDPDRILSSPLVTYCRQNERADGEFFQKLVAEERLVGLVMGLPVHMSGDESGKSREARRFGEWLSKLTGLPVRYQDERYSTADAKEALAAVGLKGDKAARRKDLLAAQAILARYLEGTDQGAPKPFFP